MGFQNSPQGRLPDANGWAASLVTTTEKPLDRSIEYWNRTRTRASVPDPRHTDVVVCREKRTQEDTTCTRRSARRRAPGDKSCQPRFSCGHCPHRHSGSGRARMPSRLPRRASATGGRAICHVVMRKPTGSVATRAGSTPRVPKPTRPVSICLPPSRTSTSALIGRLLTGPGLATEAERCWARAKGVDGCDLCGGRPPGYHRKPRC